MNRFWIFTTIFLDVFPFIFLQYLPFRDNLKLPYKKTMFICTSVLFVQFLGFVWLYEQPFYNPNVMLFYRCGLLITLSALSFFFVCDSFTKVFFVFALMAPYVIVVISTGTFFRHLLNAPAFPPHMLSSLCRLGIIAITFPPLYLAAKNYILPIMDIDGSIWQFALPVPIMFSLISLFFVDSGYEEYGVSVSELFGMLFVFFGCIFTCFLLLKALKQVQEKTEISEREKQARILLNLQTQQYNALSKNIEETKAARHDLRHHLAVIKQLAEHGNIENLREFINELVASFPQPKELYISDNPVLNSIAGHYMGIGLEKNIDLDFVFNLGKKLPCEDTDLCIIIGNLIENAIEACSKVSEQNRFIKLRAKTIENNFLLTIDNSFDGVVLVDGNSFFSRKRSDSITDKKKGVGIASVEAVVNKYNGMMKIEYHNNIFMTSVLLPIL